MTEKILTKSADILLESGFEQIASISERGDIYATLFYRNGEKFLVGAKQYAYQNLASFQLIQVKQAVNEDLVLVFYEDENESFTAFDPEFVQKNANESHGKSKIGHREWRELPLEHGADLTGYVYGVESPDTLAGDNATLGGFA